MDLCPPAITAGAIFTALIVKDIYEKNYKDILFHLVSSVVSVLGISALCQYGSDTAGWILLLIPFFVLIVGFYIQWAQGTPDPKPVPTQENTCCPLCGSCPCHCKTNWPTDCDGVPLPAPKPVIPEIVTPKPVTTNTFGCPRKA
jgi:hypothetical protein